MTKSDDEARDAYRTVADRTRTSFRVRGSRFIGTIAPTETVEAAEAFIRGIEDEFDDATHNVLAYRIHADPIRERSSDDGEPGGSAGKPALNVLRGEDLEDVAVVVTRYFGGTKLGYGGLVRAYTEAVRGAIGAAEVIERRPRSTIQAVVDYDDSGTVRGALESDGYDFEATYGERVSFAIRVPTAEVGDCRDRLRSVTSGRVELS